MNRKERRRSEREKVKPKNEVVEISKGISWKAAILLSSFFVALTLACTLPFIFKKNKKEVGNLVNLERGVAEEAISIEKLMSCKLEEIDKMGIGEMNLVASSGLPGSEEVNIEKCLLEMDEMAKHVKLETERNFHRFVEKPQEYGGSQAKYKAGMLITAVKQDYKLRYNEELRKNLQTFDNLSIYEDYFFKDSKNVFISGMLTSHKQGTCSSMPVLMIAVGRRLGYPLYLVASKGHLFCRWDDGKGNRFNFDGTGEGFSVADDKYYMNFPRPISEEELEGTHYMQSMTPRQELVTFLHIRRACLQFHKRDTEALMCAARCLHIEPKDRMNYIALSSEGVLPPSVKNNLSNRGRFDNYIKEQPIIREESVMELNRRNRERSQKIFDDMHRRSKPQSPFPSQHLPR